MSAFDRIIGYETIKTELMQICDMIHHSEVYENLGAKLPQGLLLYGDPGLGKTLMAKAFIEESGLKTYVVRRNKGNDDFIGDITDTFLCAKVNAPAIVFLDDMDKFANEDQNHRDAEEYVAVQAGIDDVKDSSVFVIATANEMWKLPRSLVRSGRFDRKIEVQCPTDKDATDIIRYYLSDKKVSDSVDLEDLSRMISYSSCAELETILNDAAINAASERKDSIEMEDLVNSVLRMQYDSPDIYAKTSEDEMRRVALHEAGHLVVCEALEPGSVGLASLRTSGRSSTNGFIHRCKELSKLEYNILISLAGKVAEELYYADVSDNGCQSDLERAAELIQSRLSRSGVKGLFMVDFDSFPDSPSEEFKARIETAVHAELENYMLRAKDILLKNRDFLEKAAEALIGKETLLYSDIRKIKESTTVTGAAA
jgi:cell division protease FtsH